MFMKCAAMIVTIGACAGVLLALRQQRLTVAGELARAQLRMSAQDERLWRLRAGIAEQTSPRKVQQMASALGPLTPIVESPRPVERARPDVPAIRVARQDRR
ncbi:MAG: hypothetical protein HBSAPP03_04230 [Phycisphaerae bacterium]|nr:MAG: hypothetical protein HBSAPP03_04230 [Phycisphaerae bacterium]